MTSNYLDPYTESRRAAETAALAVRAMQLAQEHAKCAGDDAWRGAFTDLANGIQAALTDFNAEVDDLESDGRDPASGAHPGAVR